VLNNGSLIQNPENFNFYEFNSRENLVRDDRIALSSNLSVPGTSPAGTPPSASA
jgi:hypothetical protein